MRLSALLLVFACATSAATVNHRSLQSGGMAASRSVERNAYAAADATTYRALWHDLIGGGDPLAVDFSKESVVFLLGGRRPTGGHHVEVEKVVPEADGVAVTATVKPPPADSMNIQVITYPYNVIAIARPGVKKVRWAGK
ncbi:MAG TPA: protease complex subunit PrcB family protein [Thermoanaerobaculia bacterium]|nr:protease complex subunit PrcB family protein [Thermoanaerobaculia bacterium]